MPARKTKKFAFAIALSSLLPIASALAGVAATGTQAPQTATAKAVPAVETGIAARTDRPVKNIQGFGQSLDPTALDAYRGGDDSVENDVDIHGQVDNNTAQNTISGNNTLSGDAFSNASGIATVIQNSGSNVLIQNGMVVNVQFAGSAP